jgi:hypothetical protein
MGDPKRRYFERDAGRLNPAGGSVRSPGSFRSEKVYTNVDYTANVNDSIIICEGLTTPSDITITLYPATKQFRQIIISNVGAGNVEVTSPGETIDGETSQDLSPDDSIVVFDYEIGKWKIT